MIGKERRMRVEHFSGHLAVKVRVAGGWERERGEEGKRDTEFRYPEGSFLPPDKQNGKVLIRRSLGPSSSNLLNYLAAFVYKKRIHRHICKHIFTEQQNNHPQPTLLPTPESQ